jgi:hypothetical protein
LAELGTQPGITWYYALWVLPGATVEQVQHQHDARAHPRPPTRLLCKQARASTAPGGSQIATADAPILDVGAQAAPGQRHPHTAGLRVRCDGGGPLVECGPQGGRAAHKPTLGG